MGIEWKLLFCFYWQRYLHIFVFLLFIWRNFNVSFNSVCKIRKSYAILIHLVMFYVFLKKIQSTTVESWDTHVHNYFYDYVYLFIGARADTTDTRLMVSKTEKTKTISHNDKNTRVKNNKTWKRESNFRVSSVGGGGGKRFDVFIFFSSFSYV